MAHFISLSSLIKRCRLKSYPFKAYLYETLNNSNSISMMSQNKNYVNQYESKIAYPTIALTIFAITVYILATIAAIKGYVGIGWVILINSIMAYLLFTPMHEAGHMNIVGNKKSLRWINEVIGWLSGIPILAPFYTFKVLHFRHHAHTNNPKKDPDHWLASNSWISLLFHSTTIFPIYLVKGLHLLYFGDRIVKKVKKELKIGFIGLFMIIILLVTSGTLIGWNLVFQFWILPAIIAQTLLAITFDWLPHHPHQEKSRYLNSRIFDIPGLSILLLGQNYHLIHHLYPRIPFYDYKETFSSIKDDLVNEGSDIISLEKRESTT
ncbi:MAG: fatty acid desaturase [Maribacter sp.]|jgi:fatty acid desaturase